MDNLARFNERQNVTDRILRKEDTESALQRRLRAQGEWFRAFECDFEQRDAAHAHIHIPRVNGKNAQQVVFK